jgi:hypothetical protein
VLAALEKLLGRFGLGPPSLVPPFLEGRRGIERAAGGIATVVLFLFLVGVGYSIWAEAAAGLRSVLEALPLGDAVAENRREDGRPVLVAALTALPVLAVIVGLTRWRHELVQRHLDGRLGIGALFAVSLVRMAAMVFGIGLVAVVASIAAGEDLVKDAEDGSLTRAWQLLVAGAGCAAFAWFGLRLILGSARSRRPRPPGADAAEPPRDAGSGWVSAFRVEILRPYALIVPPAVFGLAVLGGSTFLDAVLFALVVFTVFAVRAGLRASRQARDEHFAAYARSRGLELTDWTALPTATPLLGMGHNRWAERVMTGELPGGAAGVLAFYTYEIRDDEQGEPVRHPFTVALCQLDGLSDRLTRMYGEPRSAFRSESGTLGFGPTHRIRLESVAAEDRYALHASTDDDEVWLRRVFSPTFIVWLAEHSPRELGFQLWDGWLCTFVPRLHDEPHVLDAICESCSAIARRLAEESEESALAQVTPTEGGTP